MNNITKVTHMYAFHIDSSTLTDGTYELVPESKSEQREAQANLTEAAEDPNQSSEEPKANFIYATYYYSYLLAHLSLQELLGTLAA